MMTVQGRRKQKNRHKTAEETKKIKQKSDAKTGPKTWENPVCFAPKTEEFMDKIQQNA